MSSKRNTVVASILSGVAVIGFVLARFIADRRKK